MAGGGGRKRNRWDSDSDEEDTRCHSRSGRSERREEDKDKKQRPSSERDDNRRRRNGNDKEETTSVAVEHPPLVHNFYLYGCRSVDNYARIGKIDEGTYGVVSKARDKITGDIVALKQIKMSHDVCHDGFPVTALRETNVLLALDHPNIVKMREMVVGSTPDKIFMVMDYAENDLKAVMEKKMQEPFLQSEAKALLQSLLKAVAYMHEKWYIHRDLKTSNLLYDSQGVLKVCDFGLARKYGSPVRQAYTQLVVTLWYRCPELLLGATQYATAVDMWSVGCIFAEILLMKPLFPGRGEIDQMDQIFKILGCPNEETWPGFLELPSAQSVRWKWPKESRLRSKFATGAASAGSFAGGASGCVLSNAGFNLLCKLLAFDPKQRISAKDALNHEYFKESPLPKPQDQMPRFPSSAS